MNWLQKIFRRRAGFQLVAQTTFERMEARHAVRLECPVPNNYGQLMKMHGELGRSFATKAQDTEELLRRASALLIFQRQAVSLGMRGELAPAVRRRIDNNITLWRESMVIKQPTGSRPPQARRMTTRQLVFNFGL